MSKKNNPAKLLTGFGIFGVGIAAAKDLVKNFGGIEEISVANVDELKKVDGVSETLAKNIVEFFSYEENKQIIDELKSLGVNLKFEYQKNETNSKVAGKIFVVTGKLENFTREEINKFIESCGGISKNTVSRKTDFLIVGDSPGSKLTKAEEFGVRILTEKEFEKFIEN